MLDAVVLDHDRTNALVSFVDVSQTSFTIRKDPDGAFNSRYIMVTKDNVRDFIKEHRQMIKLDKAL